MARGGDTADFRRYAERKAAEKIGSGGGGGDDLDARVAVLENNVDHIKGDITEIKGDVKDLGRAHDRDFRILFGALIGVAIGLAGMMAKGFHWL